MKKILLATVLLLSVLSVYLFINNKQKEKDVELFQSLVKDYTQNIHLNSEYFDRELYREKGSSPKGEDVYDMYRLTDSIFDMYNSQLKEVKASDKLLLITDDIIKTYSFIIDSFRCDSNDVNLKLLQEYKEKISDNQFTLLSTSKIILENSLARINQDISKELLKITSAIHCYFDDVEALVWSYQQTYLPNDTINIKIAPSHPVYRNNVVECYIGEFKFEENYIRLVHPPLSTLPLKKGYKKLKVNDKNHFEFVEVASKKGKHVLQGLIAIKSNQYYESDWVTRYLPFSYTYYVGCD